LNYLQRTKEILNIEIQGLEKVRDELNCNFEKAVTVILQTLENNGKIVVTGVGKNLLIGEKISATLASTGSTSVVLNPTQAMHGDLGIVSSGDVLLAISYSGESDEIIKLIPLIKRMGVKIVALTGASDSILAKNSDEIISVTVDREACPFNMAPTTSTTATMAIGDALALVLLESRGFGKEDYAKLHPGGAIGRALLLRVCDIMRKDDRVPTIKADDLVKDALLAMTKARSGSAAVIDSENKLIAIFTDGDLRRHLATNTEILNATVAEVMTESPITVTADQLAAEVLSIFEKHNIDDLLVVDENQHLVGAIDIQDLPKLKIM
jgi:arabinose-5-phosphate isomerase